MKKTFLSVIFKNLLVAFLLLLCMELAVRLYIHLRYGVPGKVYGIYQADKGLGAVHRPHSYNTNSVINNWGFRNTQDISEIKSEGALRIYCSGGSTTFCYNLKTEDSWPSLLQDKLRKLPGHEKDEVLNAGEISFAVGHEYALARRLIPRLKPDIAIIWTGLNEQASAYLLKAKGNDLNLLLAEKKWGTFPKNLDQASFLKRNSASFKFIDHYFITWMRNHPIIANKDNGYWQEVLHPWVIANFEHTLKEYIEFLESNGCKIIIVRYADNGVKYYYTNAVRILRDRGVDIGKKEGAIICDLVPVVEHHPQKEALYIITGLHVTKKGAELVSDELLKIIANQ